MGEEKNPITEINMADEKNPKINTLLQWHHLPFHQTCCSVYNHFKGPIFEDYTISFNLLDLRFSQQYGIPGCNATQFGET